MKKFLILLSLRILSLLPLKVLQCLGGALGVLAFKFSSKFARKIKANLSKVKICPIDEIDKYAVLSAKSLGQLAIENLCFVWQNSKDKVAKHIPIDKVLGLDELTLAMDNSRPILFLTPHIGNFEVGLKYTANYFNKSKFNVMYKKSKSEWLNDLMLKGRGGTNINPVPTTRQGVAALLRAIKNNEIIGLLPDHVASLGEGEWVKFFDAPVFATSLAAKLSLIPNVATFIVGCYREDRGFSLEFIPFKPTNNELKTTMQQIYNSLEQIILKAPTQYFWSYSRFRIPPHAPSLSKEIIC